MHRRVRGERAYEVIAEGEALLHAHDVVDVILVVVFQVLQHLHLDSGLVVEALLVADDLHRHVFVVLVVEALQCLPEAALAEEVDDFVAVADVVVHHHLVVALFVVVAVVEPITECRNGPYSCTGEPLIF